MGMASGMILVSQGSVNADSAEITSSVGTSIAAGCGGNGCAGQKPQNNDRNGCASKRPQNYDRHGCAQQGRNRGYTADNNDMYQQGNQDNQYNQQSNKMMTEGELMSQLSPSGKAQYQSLDAEGKALALKLASQSCAGKNDCKGLNSCKTSQNSCAGKGTCAGTSVGPFKDKNVAVKVAAQKMAEKRNKMNGNSW